MGKMIIITAPSGAGKTTIVRHLLKTFKEEFAFSVSATTRPPRAGEVHGKDYYFLTEKKFRKKIDKGAFAEWEEVYPRKFYGTLKKEIKRIWKAGKHIIFDIEVKGATNMKKIYDEKALAIFIKPPSLEELLNRLQKRDTESNSSIKERIARAKDEMTYENNFDLVLVNDVLEVALAEGETIVQHFLQQAKKEAVTKKKESKAKKKAKKEKKKLKAALKKKKKRNKKKKS